MRYTFQGRKYNTVAGLSRALQSAMFAYLAGVDAGRAKA